MWILKRLKEERKLFYVETFAEFGAIASQEVNEAEKWQRRYGHLNEHDPKKVFAKDMVLGVPSGIMGPLPQLKSVFKANKVRHRALSLTIGVNS